MRQSIRDATPAAGTRERRRKEARGRTLWKAHTSSKVVSGMWSGSPPLSTASGHVHAHAYSKKSGRERGRKESEPMVHSRACHDRGLRRLHRGAPNRAREGEMACSPMGDESAMRDADRCRGERRSSRRGSVEHEQQAL